MSTPVIATKLFIPPPRPNAVSRSRLIARLDAGLHRTLTMNIMGLFSYGVRQKILPLSHICA